MGIDKTGAEHGSAIIYSFIAAKFLNYAGVQDPASQVQDPDNLQNLWSEKE